MQNLTTKRLTLPQSARLIGPLFAIEFALVLLSTAGQLIRYNTRYDSLLGLIDQFYVDNENNIPTYFSSLLLLASGALLGVIALLKQQVRSSFRHHWKWLACLFVLLSVDEVASIHEMLIHPLKRYANLGGPFFFGWVVPGGLFVLVVGLSFLRFVRSLPAPVRRRVVWAGLTYLAGSLGVEMVGGNYYEQSQGQDLGYSLIVTLEETLEMTGTILFIRALFLYLSTHLESVALRFRTPITAAYPLPQSSYAATA